MWRHAEIGVMHLQAKKHLGLLAAGKIGEARREASEGFSLGDPRRNQACLHFDFGLLASWAMREEISAALDQFVVMCYSSSRTNMAAHFKFFYINYVLPYLNMKVLWLFFGLSVIYYTLTCLPNLTSSPSSPQCLLLLFSSSGPSFSSTDIPHLYLLCPTELASWVRAQCSHAGLLTQRAPCFEFKMLWSLSWNSSFQKNFTYLYIFKERGGEE